MVQRRLICSLVRQLPLTHQAPLTDRPGSVQVLKGVIDELKATWMDTASFSEAVAAPAGIARLRELADIHFAYQA